VLLTCEALGISRSGFYAWLSRPRSQRSLDDEVLGGQVQHSFVGSDRTYGARRVWHDVLALGQRCGLHRIERLMKLQALRARPRRRGLPADRGEPAFWPVTSWTGNSRQRHRTRSGSRTSPTSGRLNAGSMSR
jgi:putative transposase